MDYTHIYTDICCLLFHSGMPNGDECTADGMYDMMVGVNLIIGLLKPKAWRCQFGYSFTWYA
jgi:hypothetical protein